MAFVRTSQEGDTRIVAFARPPANAATLPVYARVKEQLRRDTVQRMRAIIAGNEDPMLQHWV